MHLSSENLSHRTRQFDKIMSGCPPPVISNKEHLLFITGDLNTRMDEEYFKTMLKEYKENEMEASFATVPEIYE